MEQWKKRLKNALELHCVCSRRQKTLTHYNRAGDDVDVFELLFLLFIFPGNVVFRRRASAACAL